jgi:hypothetical protein
MDRREFITGSLATASAYIAGTAAASAYERCGLTPQGQICEAGIEIAKLPTLYAQQEMSQWCWAASISMIFRYYGYHVPQEEIVASVYGRLVNLPALSGSVISQQLNRTWTDRRGNRFRASLQGVFDADAGVSALNNLTIVQSLAAERPLLLGNLSHAVVMTAVAYQPTPMGPYIFNYGVVDPYPRVGARGPLNAAELVPMPMGQLRYLALPTVRAI